MASTRSLATAASLKSVKADSAQTELKRSNQVLQALDMAQIVAYYRNRVDAFESDR